MKKIVIEYTNSLDSRVILGSNKEVKEKALKIIDSYIKNSSPSPYQSDLLIMKKAFENVNSHYIQYTEDKILGIMLSVYTKTQIKERLQSITELF